MADIIHCSSSAAYMTLSTSSNVHIIYENREQLSMTQSWHIILYRGKKILLPRGLTVGTTVTKTSGSLSIQNWIVKVSQQGLHKQHLLHYDTLSKDTDLIPVSNPFPFPSRMCKKIGLLFPVQVVASWIEADKQTKIHIFCGCGGLGIISCEDIFCQFNFWGLALSWIKNMSGINLMRTAVLQIWNQI